MRQGNRLTYARVLTPKFFVGLENFWVRETKTIDALLHVADQKTICVCAFAADGPQNGVLRLVDVLIFIHENKFETRLPFLRQRRRTIRRGVPKQAQGELFQVGKI